MPHILLLEDEPSIADTLLYSLHAEGWTVDWCSLLSDARTSWQQADLLLLDVGLPDGSGFEFCKEVRRHSEVPVIFLTARHHEIDRVVGLEIGADDYVLKPFSPRELVARIKANLKRWQKPVEAPPASAPALANTDSSQPVRLGDFRWQASACRIWCCEQLLELTALEYRLLQFFLQQPDQVHSRDQLLDAGGIGHSTQYERNIDTHIKSLRAKLRQCSDRPYLLTHRGFGYRLAPAGDTEPGL